MAVFHVYPHERDSFSVTAETIDTGLTREGVETGMVRLLDADQKTVCLVPKHALSAVVKQEALL